MTAMTFQPTPWRLVNKFWPLMMQDYIHYTIPNLVKHTCVETDKTREVVTVIKEPEGNILKIL